MLEATIKVLQKTVDVKERIIEGLTDSKIIYNLPTVLVTFHINLYLPQT